MRLTSKFETELEKLLAAISLVLFVLALGTAVLFIIYYRVAREEKLRADSQPTYGALAQTTRRPQAVAAQFKANELIIEFSPAATDADKKRLYQLASIQPSEVLQATTEGSSLSGGVRPGEIVLATVKPKKTSQEAISALKVSVSPIASKEGEDVLANLPLGAALAQLSKNPLIKSVQPNYLYSLTDGPNDEIYQKGQTWNLYSAGKPGSESILNNQYGSQADGAWKRNIFGDYGVYVAVIDSGIDAGHPDLKANVDTAHAVDYVRDPKNPADATFVNKDEIGHGTHVAGIIGAVGDNSIGVAGVAWKVKMIPMKVLRAGPNQLITEATLIKAFLYATQLKESGVNIVAINASLGSYGIKDNSGRLYPDYALLKVIKGAARAGILCVSAAGNDSIDNDKFPMYPASFDTTSTADGTAALPFNSVVSVAALSPDGSLAAFSNHGEKTVHLGAPGVAIISPIPSSSQFARSGIPIIRSSDGAMYGTESGTSAAAPHVTGAIVLYYGNHPNATPQEVHDRILSSQTQTPSLIGNTSTGGRLDLSKF